MSNSNQNPDRKIAIVNLVIAFLTFVLAVIYGFPNFWIFFKKEISPNFQQLKIEEKLPVRQNL